MKVDAARRSLDVLASLQAKADKAVQASATTTSAATVKVERVERDEISMTVRAREAMTRAADRQTKESFARYRASSRIKSATLKAEQAEIDRAARSERQRIDDEAKAVRDVFNMRARWRRSEKAAERRADREREKFESDAARRRRALGGAGRDLASLTITTAGRVGLVAGVGTMVAARKILGIESDVDSAELDLRAASSMSAKAARDLRTGWAATAAERLGADSASMLRSYTEALKVGIPDEGAKVFTETARQASEAWGLSNDVVVDSLGQMNSILTSAGQKFDASKFREVANATTMLADRMATTPEAMLSFMRRGAGATQRLNMPMDLGLAFGAASTSLGNEAGQSGRLFDFMAGRLTDLSRLARGRGDQGTRVRELVRSLGYSSANALDRDRRARPDDFIFDLIERFRKIRDPKKKDEALQTFAGQEWSGELGRLIGGSKTLQEAKRIAIESRSADALGARWKLHTQKLSFVAKQISASASNVVSEFGVAVSPLAHDIGESVVRLSGELRAGGVGEAFRQGLDGLVQGLIGRPVKEALDAVHIGKLDPAQFASVAREVGEGLRVVVDTIAMAGSAFGSVAHAFGSTGGRFTAELLAFSAVALVLKPVVGIVASFAKVLGSAAVVMAPGRLGLAVAGLTRLLGPLAGLITLAASASRMNIFKAPDLSVEGALRFVDPGLANRLLGKGKANSDGDPKVEKQSFGDDGHASLLHRMAFVEPLEGLRSDFRTFAGQVSLVSLGATSSETLSSIGGTRLAAAEIGLPRAVGGSPVNSYGLGRRGIIGGGAGGNYGTPSASLLDFIAKSEGADYNVSWGNGRFMPGGREQNLTGKSLNEILALGNYMRAQPGSRNSSAMGRYQITGSTIRDLMGRMHLTGAEKFDRQMQDAMASRLIQDEGPRALQRWEGLKIGGRMGQAQALLHAGQVASVPSPSNFEGLPLKSPEAVAGGASSKGITDLAKSLVALDVPGGMGRLTALNDAYHHRANPLSRHTQGLAADFTIKDASKSSETAERVRQLFRAAGLAENAFKVIDEYRNPSGHATGGHIHYQLNSKEAAQTYAAYAAAHRNGSDPSKVAADLAGGGDRGSRARAADAPTHSGQGNTYITQHIQGGTNDPEALANKVQRRVNQESRWRVHDVENI